ncbi:MAG: hypothetical protein KDD44_06480, partial [Bdellovibrionales bacterium]|nr:hypothetical protein [Bdellovibrionales bacterium]
VGGRSVKFSAEIDGDFEPSASLPSICPFFTCPRRCNVPGVRIDVRAEKVERIGYMFRMVIARSSRKCLRDYGRG